MVVVSTWRARNFRRDRHGAGRVADRVVIIKSKAQVLVDCLQFVYRYTVASARPSPNKACAFSPSMEISPLVSKTRVKCTNACSYSKESRAYSPAINEYSMTFSGLSTAPASAK